MAVAGRFFRSIIGPPDNVQFFNGTGTSYAMAALAAGWCARIMATSTKKIFTVYVNFVTIATAGTITLTLETIDATTGKPTGTLVDANCTKTFTPIAGWNTVTFAVAPTTALVIGTEYGIVLATATAGTTQSLRSHYSATPTTSALPCVVLTTTTAGTRASFVEVTSSVPIVSFSMDDATEESGQGVGGVFGLIFNVYGTRSYGAKFVVPAGFNFVVAGIAAGMIKNGVPTGDLRGRIFDAADALVSGATCTADKDSLATGLSGAKRVYLPFPGPVTLVPGTYRVFFDQTDHASVSGNNYSISSGAFRSAALNATNFYETSTLNIDAGSIVWTDTTIDMPGIALQLDDITDVSSGSYRGQVIQPGGWSYVG